VVGGGGGGCLSNAGVHLVGLGLPLRKGHGRVIRLRDHQGLVLGVHHELPRGVPQPCHLQEEG